MPPMGPRATYFLPANFDFPPPPDGPVKLGQLISEPENPGRPVNPKGPVSFEGYEGMKMYTNSTEFSLRNHGESTAEAGLFLRALELTSAKLGAGLSRGMASYILNDIKKLDVEFIEPTNDYVKASMEVPEVKNALKGWGLKRKRAFMVTGIKIAYPDAKLERQNGFNSTFAVEGGASGLQGIVNAEGHASLQESAQQMLKLIPRKPFVYAYRLQECYYRLKSLRHKEFTDGALCGVGAEDKQDGSETPEDTEEDVDIEFDYIDEDDVCEWEAEDGYEYEINTLVDEQDGSPCDIIVPVSK
ncbi:hypothetical protein MferCBS31731_007703 [Microsporum ferrugineum]